MIDEHLARSMARAFAPPPVIAPSVFAESEIVLPPSANAVPGPLRLAPYQKELVDSIAADDGTDIVVMMLSSQIGKSISVDCQLGYVMACDPGPALHVSPTNQRAEEFTQDRLDALINSSPALRKIVGTGLSTRKGSTGGANSLSAKSFPGGTLNMASSFKADELAARSVRFLFLDEVDRFAQSAGQEGDPIMLALKRTRTYEGRGRRVVMVSTPTSRTGSRIAEWYEKGDKRRFMMDCPDCGHVAPFAFENLKWNDGKPETAYLPCGDCGAVIDETKRRAMLEHGRWIATAVGEKGIRSYHLNELSSRFSNMESVARQFDAAKTPLQKQAFYNTCLGEVYDAGTEVELTTSELQQRAEPIAAPYAANIQFITAGVDVQSNRVECTFLAHHADDTLSVLNHLKLMGDTSGDSIWQSLDVALGTVFPLTNGKSLNIMATAVDSGFNADQVTAFVASQRRKSRQCYAVKGRSGFDQPALKWGGRLKGVMKLLLVGVDGVKLAVQKHLAMQTIGSGFIRLPDHLPPEYFEGLAAEELRVKIVKGAPRYEYHRTYRFNEPLDCLTYARAIAQWIPKQALTPPPPGPDVKHWAAKLNAAHNS
jgi:phage terminase large subunit GpA-like protein